MFIQGEQETTKDAMVGLPCSQGQWPNTPLFKRANSSAHVYKVLSLYQYLAFLILRKIEKCYS